MNRFSRLLHRFASLSIHLPRLLRSVAVVCAMMVCGSAAWGADYTWTGGGSDTNWTTAANWSGSGYPSSSDDTATFTGASAATVKLDLSVTVGTITTNTGGSSLITIDTNGYTLTCSSMLLNQTSTATFDANVTISGTGTVKTEAFDFPDKPKTTAHTLTIENGATFCIMKTFYGNADSGTLAFAGTGTLYIPASGSNLDWGRLGITWGSSLTILPYGSPSDYTVSASGIGSFPGSGITVTITRKETNGSYKTVYYPCKATITNASGTSHTYTLGSTTLVSGTTYTGSNVSGTPTSPLSIANNVTSANYTLSCSPADASGFNDGDGITLVIYTPDYSMELATVSYHYKTPEWTGAADTTWTNTGNWTGISTIDDLTGKDIVINSVSSKNYPVISSAVSLASLTVTSNASVTVESGGTLTANNIACTGNSRITATAGAVVFGYNSATAASWSATYPSYSQFGTVTVSSGCTLTSASDMYISGSWTNNGTFTDTSHTVYFIPSSSSSIGGSKSTTFYGLNCTSAGGKTLSINSTIAVTTLTLTGTSSASRLTIDGTSGQINLASSQTTGNYLTIDTTNVNVADTSGTVSGSTYTSANSSDDSGKAAAKNGWIFLVENAVWIGGTATGSVYSWDTVENWQDGIEPTADSAVTYSAAATTSPTLASDVSVKSIAVPSGMSLDLVNHTLTVSGNFSDDGELSLYGTSADQLNVTGTKTIGTKVTYYGGGTSVPISGITLYADLSVSGSGTTLTTTGDVTISGTLTNSGTVAVAANTLSFASYSGTSDTVTVTAGGTITQSGGSASSTIGTLTMTSATGKAVVLNGPTGSAYNLAVTNATYSSADVTTTGYVSLPAGTAGALTVSNDALSITGDFTITGNAQFNGTVIGTGVLTINGTSAINTTAINTVGAQTYSGAVTIGADTTFTSSSGTGKITFAAIDDSAVSSHTVTVVTKNTGTTDAVVFGGAVGGSKALKSLSVTATTITMSATTVNAGTQVYTGAVTTSSSATTLTGAVTNNGGFTCGGDVTITGTLTNNSMFTCGGVTKITGTVTNAGTITSGTGGITFNGSITGGVLNGNSGVTITVNNSSPASFAPNTFMNNGCAFVLAGSGAVTIGGGYTFNTFSCVTPGAAKTISFKGGSVTKADSFTVTGESGKLISLQSDTSGTKWYLNAATTNVSVSYAKITDSEAYDVLITKTANSTDGGNTVNWFNASYTWKGTLDSNWSTIANWLITGTTRAPTAVPISNNSSVDIIVDNGADNALVLGTAAASNPAGGTDGLITLKSLTIKESASLSINGRNITAATVINNGSVTLSGSETLTFTSLTTNATTSTVTYNGASVVSVNFKQNGLSAVTYNNLVVSGTYDGSTATDTTLQLYAVAVTVSGTLTNYGVIKVNDSGSVSKTDSARGKFVYSTAAHTITDYTSDDYYDLTIDSSGYTQTAGGALAVKNNLAVIAGTFECDSHAVTVGGTMTNAGTTAVGTGSLAVTGTTSNTGTISAGTGSFTAKSTTSNTGIISLSTGTVTFTGDYASTSTASLTETGAGSIYFLGAADLTNNTFTCGTGTVYLNGSSAQLLTTNGQSFYNVTLSNTVSTAVTVSGSMAVTGALTVGANRTLNLAANNVALSVTGATVNNGTISGNTLNATPAAMTFSRAYSGTSGTLSATKGTTTFGANADLSSTTFTNNDGAVVFNGGTQTLTIGANSTTFNSIALNATTSFTLADGTNTLTAVSVTDAYGSESITLNASVTVTNAVTFNTTGTVTLGNDGALTDVCTFTGGLIHTAGDTAFASAVKTTNAAVTVGDTTNGKNISINKKSSVMSGTGTVTINGTTNFADNVSFTIGDNSSSNQVTIHTVTVGTTTYGTLTVQNAAGDVSFTGDIGTSSLRFGTLTLSKTGGSVMFADGKAVYASTFTPAAGAYAVVMNSTTAAVTNAVTFANTGTLTLGNSASDSFTFGSGVTATAPSSKTVAGTITATNGDINFGTSATTVAAVTKFDGSASGAITLGDVALASGVTLTAGAAADSNSITFGKITPASNSNGTVAVVNAAGDVSFTGDIGTSSLYLGTLTLSKTGGSVTFADGKNVYASTFTPAAGAYAVVMNSDTAAVTNAVTFANTGTLTLGNSASDSFTFGSGVTATAPSSKTVAGTITATANNINFGTTATTASAEIHLVSNAGSINTASLSSAAGLLVVTAGAAASFNGAVSQTYTTGTFSVTAGTSVKFGSTVSSTGDISVSANSGSGTITANGNISASAGKITLTGNVILSSDAVFSVNTSGTNTVTITGKLDAFTADAQGLEIDTGTGAITLGGAIGETAKLKYLYLNTKQTSEFTIPVIKGVTTVKISTCGKVGQSGAIIGTGLYIKTLAAAGSGTITLYNSGNDFDNVILAALSADGTAPVASYISYQDSDGFAIASDSSFLSTVTAYSSAGIISSDVITLYSGGAVTQTGAVTGNGSLLILGSGPYTLGSSDNKINNFTAKVTGGAVALTDSAVLDITTLAAAHDSSVTASGVTLAKSGAAFTLTNNSNISTLIQNVTTNAGNITFTGPVVVKTSGITVASANGAIAFNSTLDGTTANAQVCTVSADTGSVSFGTATGTGAVGSSAALGTFTVTGTGGITAYSTVTADSLAFGTANGTEKVTLYGAVTTNNKNAQFKSPVVLANGIAVTSGAGDGDILFDSTISGSAKTLSLTAGTGNVQMTGAVGSSSASLGAITIVSAKNVAGDNVITPAKDAGAIYAASLTQSAGTGTTRLSSVTLTGAVSLSTTAAIDLNGTVIAPLGFSSSGTTFDNTGASVTTTNKAISINHTGIVTLGAALSSGSGDVTINTTDGTILSADEVITTSTGAVKFNSTINSDSTSRALTVMSESGSVTFAKTVGTSALSTLTVTSTGTISINGSSVTTTGAQTYSGAVTLGADVAETFTAGSGKLISFASSLKGNSKDVVFATANVSFAGTVSEIAALTVNTGTTTVASTGSISTTGVQTYTGAVTNLGTINVPQIALGNSAIVCRGDYIGTDGTNTGKLVGNTTTNPYVDFYGNVTMGTFTASGDIVRLFGTSGPQFAPGDESSYADIIIGDATSTTAVTLIGDIVSAAALSVQTNASLSTAAYSATFTGTVMNGGTITVGSGILTAKSTVTNNGTLNGGTGTLALYGDFTNAKTFNCDSGTVSFLGGSGSPSSITGAYTFNNFICGTETNPLSAKMVRFEKKRTFTVKSNFTVFGTSSSYVTLTTTDANPSPGDTKTWWNITVDALKVTCKYANVGYSNSTSDISAKTTDAKEIYYQDESYTTLNWFNNHAYTWKGTTDTKWATLANWENGFGKAPSLVPEDTGRTVSITIDTDSGKSDLVLEKDVSVGTLVINSAKRMNIVSYVVTAATSITNNGTIALTGGTAIPLKSTEITHGDSSAIEYTGWADGSPTVSTYTGMGLATSSFVNLTITGTGAFVFNTATALTVSGTTKSAAASITTTNSTQTYTGAVTLTNGTSVFTANTITIGTSLNSSDANGSIEMNGAVVLGNSVPATGVTITAGTGSVIFDRTVTGTNQALTITSNNTTVPAVLFTGKIGESSAYLGTIVIKGAVASGGSAQFKSDVYAASIAVSGSSILAGAMMRTTGNQTYTGAVTVSSSSSLQLIAYGTSAATVTFENTLTGNGKDISIGSPVILTNALFKNTVQFFGALYVSGNSTFDGIVGSESESDKQITTISVGGTTTDNTTLIATTSTQTYAGAVSLYADATFAGTTITFGDTVSGEGYNLTIAGKTVLKGSVKTTNGTQTYKDTISVQTTAVTFTANQVVLNKTVVQTVAGTITFAAPVLLNADITFANSNSKNSDITFNSTIDAATANGQSATFAVNTGYLLFKERIGSATTPIHTLTVTQAGDVTFEKVVTVNELIQKNGSGATTFDDAVVATNGSVQLTTVKVIINGTSITAAATGATVIFTAAVELQTDATSIIADKTITFNSTVDGAQNLLLTTNGTDAQITFTGAVGTMTAVGKSGDGAASAITIAGNNTCTFENTVTVNGVLTQKPHDAGNTVVFKSNVTQNTSGTKGNVFNGNVTFFPSASSTFTAAQPVVFGTDAADVVTLSMVNESVIQTIDTHANNAKVTFNAVIEGVSGYAGKASLAVNAGTGAVLFLADFGKTVALGSMVLTAGDVTIDSAATASNAKSLTVTQSGIYHQKEKTSVTLTGAFTQNAGAAVAQAQVAQVQVAGTIAAAGGITFASDTYVDHTAQFNSASAKITFAKDVHIAPPATEQVTFTSEGGVVADKNCILYSGTLVTQASITVSGDLLLLGAGAGGATPLTAYSNDDSVTGVAGLFAYSATGRVSGSPLGTQTTAAVKATIASAFPDGSQLPVQAAWCGAVDENALAGKTIKCAGNFYDNGVDLKGASSWTLSIPANDDAHAYFAEAYNMTVTNSVVVVNTGATAEGTVAKVSAAENCVDGGGNTNGDGTNKKGWDFTHLAIKKVYTVYDDVLCIEFSEPLENTNNEVTDALSTIQYDNGNKVFAGIYTDNTGETALSSGTEPDTLYLKTTDNGAYRWNTDATGITAGAAESTDRGRTGEPAAHRSCVPDIAIAKATATLYQTVRDTAKNRIYQYIGAPADAATPNSVQGARYTATVDNCKPVLVAVYAGQELHTTYDASVGASSQPAYDSHNFIEFQYSEPVNIGNIPAVTADTTDYSDEQNLRAQTTASADSGFASATEHGGAISAHENGVTVAGYASIASGSVTAWERSLSGTKYTSTVSTTIHSLYRKFSTRAQTATNDTVQTHRIRVAVAGYVDGTVTANAKTYHNWNGYVTAATIPSGAVTRIANDYITDVAKEIDGTAINNLLTSTDDENHALPELSVNTYDALMGASADSGTTLYGSWDTSRPVFALYMMQTTGSNEDSDQIWSKGSDLYQNTDESSQFEIIGTTLTTTSSYLDRVEFHLFDNTPQYDFQNESYNWVSKNGWFANGNTTAPFEYAQDVSGGSRSTASKGKSNRTFGGIRRSSLDKAPAAFKYTSSVAGATEKSFSDTDMTQTVKSLLFDYSDDETLATTAPDDDSLYFALMLNSADTELSLTTTFDISFDDSACFITDLAGNLVTNTGSKKLSSIDRVVPQFSLNVAAVGKDELYMVFSKKLSTQIQNDFSIVTDSLEFISMDSTPSSDSATKISDLSFTGAYEQKYKTGSVTCVVFKLNRVVTLSDIEHTWVRVKKPSATKPDPLTGVEAYVTPITDNYGNYMIYYSCHALSDFAVNAIKPIYAYDITDDGTGTADADTALNTIHDFTGQGTTDNKLITNRDIKMQVRIADAIDTNGTVTQKTDDKPIVFFDSSITGTRADLYNKRTTAQNNVWLPIALPSFNTTANAPENPAGLAQTAADTTDSSLRYFTIPDGTEDGSFGWKSNDVIQFLFGITNSADSVVTIDNDGDESKTTEKVPLYALRLDDENDITSFNLWQFSLIAKKTQRGGVTILNNVINPTKDEETVVQVDAEAGNLLVAVMTLDGNIISYLEHGTVTAGTHYYRWNGKNNAGNAVARGLYFVRVVGEGIDETRKVMVVK